MKQQIKDKQDIIDSQKSKIDELSISLEDKSSEIAMLYDDIDVKQKEILEL